MKCATIGNMIIGCGSDPCRCGRLREVFAEERAQVAAELEADLYPFADYPDPPDDGMTPIERWLS